MKLKVLLPNQILVDQSVTKIIAEGVNGSFCLLPRHIDLVTALVPGVLSFTLTSGKERFMAIDEGILIKCQQEVLVSTLNAVKSDDLETLKQAIENQFYILDEQEKATRSALTKFEANIIRHFQEMGNL
jgi:F-type H+-transporting ATPase subunit epsilon